MADTMIRVPLTYKESVLEAPFLNVIQDTRITNHVLRYFAKQKLHNPTVEMVIDNFAEIRRIPGLGKKSLRKLVSVLTDLSITTQTDEQLLENAVEFVALNKGVANVK